MRRSYRDENYSNVYRIRTFTPRSAAFRYLKQGLWFAAFAAASFLVLSFVTYAALAKATSATEYRAPGNLVQVECVKEYQKFERIEYSARFEDRGRPMRIEVGYFNLRKGKGYPKARVLALQPSKNTGRCEAICDVVNWDFTAEGFAGDFKKPQAMDLRCYGTGLGALETWATLGFSGNRTELKFGTWAQGYNSMPLRTELDAYRGYPKASVLPASGVRTSLRSSRSPGA